MKKIILAQAQRHDLPGVIGEGEGLGPWSSPGDIGPAAATFATIISNIIGVMTIIAGIWFIFQFIIGAWGFLTAGEDPKKVQGAQKKITNAAIGLVIVVAAYALISLFGNMLGLDILNIESLITGLKAGGG